MQQRLLYLPGALAGVIFFAAVYALAPMLDGYSHISQTVSEIGRQGSPAEGWLQAANLTVAICLLVFAWGLYVFARTNDVSRLPAFFVACYAVAEMGVAAFPTPHKLHNVFGLSMMIGYMAPLVLAVSWKNLVDARRLRAVSWVAFVLVSVTIFLNLSPIFMRDLYPLEYYGVVQRGLLFTFYGWCLYLGMSLFAVTR